MKLRILGPAIAAAVLSTLAAAPAQASLFCEVIKTRDNFVALRDAPNPSGKLLARMKQGDEVMLEGDPVGAWTRVTFWPDNNRIEAGEKARTIRGFVNRRLLDMCG